MISLEKKDILESILRVGKILESVVLNPDEEIAYIIAKKYIEYDENQYYKDYRIFCDLICLRLLSYFEDSFLDLISNDELDFEEVKSKIFVNSDDAKRFSNKQIIKYIRNAVSHSDENKELFKISPNGKFIEIELKKVKPIPFHIKATYGELISIVNKGLSVCKGKYCTLIDKENKKLFRFYFKNIKRINIRTPKEISCMTSEEILYVVSKLKENNIEYDVKEYLLTYEQIKILEEYEKKFGGILKQFPELRDTFYSTLYDSIVPLATEKIYALFSRLSLFMLLYRFPKYTFNQYKDEIVDGQTKAISKLEGKKSNTENNQKMSELAKFNYDFQLKIGLTLEHFFQTLKYLNSMPEIANNEFLTYYFSCLCDEDIVINEKKYQKNNVRDAFIHGRYFTCLNGDIMCFDAQNGKNNDYNFYWTEHLPLKPTINSCIKSIYEQNPEKKI